LGAGASKPSGIPTGSELVTRWLKELHERLDKNNQPFETWAIAPHLSIEGFDLLNAASFYPRVYERRFYDNPDEGYACLEDLMSEKDPSPGYSILAKTMETQRHKVVISTNFDNLVADALSIYTNTFPFVCGHESLTGFVRAAMRRPLVCKIHRDLLLGPKNDPRSVKRLHEAWAGTLRALFAHYTPVFIGYGGNDDSLMDLLESLDPGEIKGQMIWCYYEKGEGPSKRVRELVAQHRGALVPVPDFDLLMVLLGAAMGIKPLDYVLEERAKERTAKYQERILALDTAGYPNVAIALAATFERAGGGWWAWELKARAELDYEKREAIYRQGIQLLQNSHELHTHFANFMAYQRQKLDEAEQLFRKALELAPNSANVTGWFASFMTWGRKNADEAEWLYRKALELDPKDAIVTGDFANFMFFLRKNSDEAERLYRKTLELDPNYAANACNFGEFLVDRDRVDEAIPLLQRAWTLNQGKPNQLSGEVALYIGIIEHCTGRDDTQTLGRLKTLLLAGFQRLPWTFDAVLETAKAKLSVEDHALYSALAEAILDADRVTTLDTFERWRSVTPISLDQPWEIKAG
jgi:tetratricopeptide (TPR) repeat protein